MKAKVGVPSAAVRSVFRRLACSITWWRPWVGSVDTTWSITQPASAAAAQIEKPVRRLSVAIRARRTGGSLITASGVGGEDAADDVGRVHRPHASGEAPGGPPPPDEGDPSRSDRRPPIVPDRRLRL